MSVIDRNLAFDFGFAAAKRANALRSGNGEALQIEDDVLATAIASVMSQHSIDEEEAIRSLQLRYDEVCSRREPHPMAKVDGKWIYRVHCTSCKTFVSDSSDPVEPYFKCERCSS